MRLLLVLCVVLASPALSRAQEAQEAPDAGSAEEADAASIAPSSDADAAVPRLPEQRAEQALEALSTSDEALPVDLWPASSTVVTGDELRRHGYRTLGEALADMVGVERARTSRGFRYGMRGILGGLVLVVDGVPQIDPADGAALEVDEELDLADVERVEIVRGPGSALDGVGALSGTVRVTTRRPGLTGAEIEGGITDHGQGEVGGALTARKGDAAVRGRILYRSGPEAPWKLENVPSRFILVGWAVVPTSYLDTRASPDSDGSLLAHVAATWAGLRLDGSLTRTDTHSPVSSYSHGLLEPGSDQDFARDRLRLRLSWDHAFGLLHLTTALFGYREIERDRLAIFPAGGSFPPGGDIFTSSDWRGLGALVRADLAVADHHRLAISVFGELTRVRLGSDATDPDSGETYAKLATLATTTGQATAAVEYQGDFGSGLHLTAGAAVEWRTSYGWSFAPRAAASWVALPWLSLRATYAEGIRAPAPNDVAALTQAVIVGLASGAQLNAALSPEHARTAELGLAFSPLDGLVKVDLAGFLTRHENAIRPEVVGMRWTPVNVAPRLVVGAELSATAEIVRDLLRASLGVSYARTVDGPRLEDDLLAAVGQIEVSPFERLDVGVRGRALYRQGLTPSRSSVLADVYAAWRVLDRHLAVRVALRNAFDAVESASDAAALGPGPAQVLIPSPGRQFFVGVEGAL
jgi:outer membrane receptor protein involved in Fe transport